MSEQHRYCTYFDQRYLDRGLAMLRSLRRFDPGCRVTVLCLTGSCKAALERLDEPGVVALALGDFERAIPDLLAVKPTRTPRDYAFTLASCLAAHLLRDAAPGEIVTYLDADLCFYSSPAPLYAAMAEASVGLVGHRHHWWSRRLEKYGRLNVGWVSFRNDAAGREAAQWWRARCIEWCHGHVERHADGDRFADQKYLDHMIEKFPRVTEIAHPGANLGPWNIRRHTVARGRGRDVLVDGQFPLIFFHYSGLREGGDGQWLCSNVSYLAPFSRFVREQLYVPYLAQLGEMRAALGGLPEEDTPNLMGSPPARRHRIAPLLRLAGRLAGHYVRMPRAWAGAAAPAASTRLQER
jgi:hypothetical protein